MGKLEYLALLMKSIESWNRWREFYSNKSILDLRGINLGSAILSHINLHNADLSHSGLSCADLGYANLSDTFLNGAFLVNTKLNNADLSRADLREAFLINANLSGANLSNARLHNTTLFKADLSGADLSRADLSRANLSDTDLYDADLRGVDLSNANLSNANLSNAKLNGAMLNEANLREADMGLVDLSDANLRDADLRNANLRGAFLINANLTNANLNNTDLDGITAIDTNFAQLDLRGAKGLAEIHHRGPSYVELHTIQLPPDGSALHFLRGAGVPDEWIDLWRATAMYPIQYHSCFLSYAHQDDNLARRLHSDLQDHGVRCWFAPHDMHIGDRIRPRIDEAIHLQDKLLLILSEHSVTSGWVEHEVETALAREYRDKRTILFPIRLDNAIMEREHTGWPALVQHERHIGDFTRWKDHDQYQAAFDHLLRDLKKADK